MGMVMVIGVGNVRDRKQDQILRRSSAGRVGKGVKVDEDPEDGWGWVGGCIVDKGERGKGLDVKK